MFTGLVEALGTVAEIKQDGDASILGIAEAGIAAGAKIGDSIALNGACLTVVERKGDVLRFQAGPETLQRTNLGELVTGDRVNLECSLRLGDRLGGHIVQGHIDDVATISSRERRGEWETVWFRCAKIWATQVVSKGSVAVDGVSLTVVEVQADGFSVALIPHTMAVTTLGVKPVGASVNLETDIWAKYIQRYLQSIGPIAGKQTNG